METLTILASFAALTILAVLVGRLFMTLLKIAIIFAVLFFLASRLEGVRAQICNPTSQTGFVHTVLCK